MSLGLAKGTYGALVILGGQLLISQMNHSQIWRVLEQCKRYLRDHPFQLLNLRGNRPRKSASKFLLDWNSYVLLPKRILITLLVLILA